MDVDQLWIKMVGCPYKFVTARITLPEFDAKKTTLYHKMVLFWLQRQVLKEILSCIIMNSFCAYYYLQGKSE